MTKTIILTFAAIIALLFAANLFAFLIAYLRFKKDNRTKKQKTKLFLPKDLTN